MKNQLFIITDSHNILGFSISISFKQQNFAGFFLDVYIKSCLGHIISESVCSQICCEIQSNVT